MIKVSSVLLFFSICLCAEVMARPEPPAGLAECGPPMGMPSDIWEGLQCLPEKWEANFGNRGIGTDYPLWMAISNQCAGASIPGMGVPMMGVGIPVMGMMGFGNGGGTNFGGDLPLVPLPAGLPFDGAGENGLSNELVEQLTNRNSQDAADERAHSSEQRLFRALGALTRGKVCKEWGYRVQREGTPEACWQFQCKELGGLFEPVSGGELTEQLERMCPDELEQIDPEMRKVCREQAADYYHNGWVDPKACVEFAGPVGSLFGQPVLRGPLWDLCGGGCDYLFPQLETVSCPADRLPGGSIGLIRELTDRLGDEDEADPEYTSGVLNCYYRQKLAEPPGWDELRGIYYSNVLAQWYETRELFGLEGGIPLGQFEKVFKRWFGCRLERCQGRGCLPIVVEAIEGNNLMSERFINFEVERITGGEVEAIAREIASEWKEE